MVQLGEHFASEGRSRHSEWLRQQRWFIKAQQDHKRREEVLERQEDSLSALGSEAIIATQMQIDAFEVRLNSYDEATVLALMENQELLDAVNDRINAMLARAYVMEDGRRVFRTEDGTQVFDEFGGEVGEAELHPDQIDPSLPSWEAFSSEIGQLQELQAERTDILDFQERVDAAHEQIAGGEISEADLDALDADLLAMMPPAVRSHIPDLEPQGTVPDLMAQFRAPSAVPSDHMQNAEASAPAPIPFN